MGEKRNGCRVGCSGHGVCSVQEEIDEAMDESDEKFSCMNQKCHETVALPYLCPPSLAILKTILMMGY